MKNAVIQGISTGEGLNPKGHDQGDKQIWASRDILMLMISRVWVTSLGCCVPAKLHGDLTTHNDPGVRCSCLREKRRC